METGKKGILIRTDGNQEIATGHLMRCLSVAQALKERNLPVLFAVADHNSGQLLRSFMAGEEDFPVICLDTDYRNPAAELDRLCTAVFENNIGCVLIDSYFVTPPYLEGLHKAVKTAYIDDIYSFDYPVDLIINYDAAPPADFYRNCPYKLLGLSYTPLRKQFRGLHPEVRPQVKDILIYRGHRPLWRGGTSHKQASLPPRGTGNMLSYIGRSHAFRPRRPEPFGRWESSYQAL